VRNEAFLKSRKNEGAVQARKEAIQNLNTAFMGYQEIVRNLEEGLKVRRFGYPATFEVLNYDVVLQQHGWHLDEVSR
jgi:hypothetical protein